MIPEVRTSRLLLRAWREADRAPYAALNADPEVMRHDRRRDFDHPLLPDWSERGHVLYCIDRVSWERTLDMGR